MEATRRSPLLDFFRARLEYLACVHKADAATMPEKLKGDSITGFLKHVVNTKFVPIEVATAITKMLHDSNLPDDAKAQQSDKYLWLQAIGFESPWGPGPWALAPMAGVCDG